MARKPSLRTLKRRAASEGWAQWIRSEADERALLNGCRFDIGRAEHIVAFFPEFLRHSKGQWAGHPFELLDWQRDDVIMPLFGWVRANGLRRYNKAYVEIPKKNGKALALDTPIPTPSGWTTIGQIQAGDQVFDENGLPCNVVAVTSVMNDRPCFEVLFSDGGRIVADSQHEWITRSRKPERRRGLWTTESIAASLRIEVPGSEGANHSVAVAGPLMLEAQQLPIHPYVLGAWLGDGSSADARFTCSYRDDQLLDEIRSCGVTVEERCSSNSSTGLYVLGRAGGNSKVFALRSHSMQAKLRRSRVLGNKHIPAAYLRASFSQRLALLQGLMDTDGYCSASGQCEFTTTRIELKEGVLELVRSLGLKPSCKSGRATLYGRDCGEKHRIQFWAYSDLPVFRLERKRLRQKRRPQRPTRASSRQIVACRPVPSVPVRCIQVDAPSRMYLAGRSMIPTHNSTLAAGIGLYMLCGDNEAGSEVYSVASDRNQAGIVHREAIAMAEASDELAAALKINRSTHAITYAETRSWYKTLTGVGTSSEGLNAHCLIADELHVWRGRESFDSLRYATRARQESLQFMITTAGTDPLSVCREQHDHAQGVLNGTRVDERYFGYIRAAAKEDDPWVESTWQKANPSYGITMDPEQFEADAEEARQSPTSQATFKRYSLNIWTTGDSPWLDMDRWQKCRRTYSAEDLEGEPCWAGLDLAKTRDTTALVLVFPAGRDRYRLLPWFWLPENTAREYDQQVPFLTWERQGLITLTDGDVCDYTAIRAALNEVHEIYDLQGLLFDPYNSSHLVNELIEDDGWDPETVIKFPQTINYFAEPTAEFERRVLNGTLQHPGHEVLSWQAGNAIVRTDSNANKRPVKPKPNDIRKIDGVVAAIMALAGSLAPEEGPSIYEEPGNVAC